jgi:hypothetical protein
MNLDIREASPAALRNLPVALLQRASLVLLSGACLLVLCGVKSRAQEATRGGTSASPATAQGRPTEPDAGIDKGDNEFGVWGAASTNSPTLIGTTESTRFASAALRYGRVFAATRNVAFEYTFDAVPLAVVSVPQFVFRRTGTGPFDFVVERSRRRAYGAGISPIGFKFNFRRRNRVQPFASTTGGLLYFNKQMPVPDSSQFNFTFDFGGGVQILTRNRKAFTVGYKFQHISNGYTGQFNPGMDVNVIYAGFSVFR